MSDTTWSFSQTFSAEFQASRTDLESRVQEAKSTTITADDLQILAVDLAKLNKTLADATGSLPGYDQRQFELQVKAIEKSLQELRPKSKFAFKRKPPGPTTTTTTPTPAATSNIAPPPSTTTPSTNLTLSSHSSQYLTKTALPPASQSSDLSISDLSNCIVNLLDSKFSALHIRNLTDTVLLLPVIQGSILLHDLRRCTVVAGCHQFRMHTSTNVDVYLAIQSAPIIEHCSHIRFSTYPSSLSKEITAHEFSVQDFSHIKSTPSPNWAFIPGLGGGDGKDWPVGGVEDISASLSKLLPDDSRR
ncbi:tubulin binding cofactor C-domain-containing protein [Roridomyces roridus]|uniref:Tubulin binding cofactor C-domain-containing protein n=1 Tax=Roridomyces roridus TaxID=1738132 RepID=A0AAD7BR38_9AGAR|nr:tubulin binding cofactor C-domain-containing protein [Roridomyces roridus]